MIQLDLFSDDCCAYPGCNRPITHHAVADWHRGRDTGRARVRCCLDHANYYARGWLGPVLLYPAVRDAVWLEAAA